MRTKLIVAGVSGLMLLGGVTGWRARPVQVEAPVKDPRLGKQLRHELRLSVQLGQEAASPVTVTVEGEWVTTTIAVRPGERDVECELRGARVTGGGVAQVQEAELDALAARLSRRFWVTYRDDGSALRIHVQRELTASDRNLLQLLVTETELVRPPKATAHWTAMERDGSGTYFATYQSDAAQVIKTKLKYFNSENAGVPSAAIEVTSGRWQFTLNGDGELATLEGSEQLRISVPIAAPPSAKTQANSHLELRAEVHLRATGTARVTAQLGSLERERTSLDTLPVGAQAFDPQSAQLARDRRLLEGHTTQELLGMAPGTDPLLPARLAALFRRQPEAIVEGMQLVRRAGGRRLITDALATAGTPEAIAALGALARDRTTPRQLRIDAVNALLRRSRPGATELGIAAELVDEPDAEVRRAARLIYGGLAHALAEVDPERRAAVERELLARYAQAGAGERADLLDALGNSASPQIFATAVAALKASEAEVRIAAAGALGRVEDRAADRVLADHLRGEQDERVRLAVVSAAAERWPDRPTSEAPPRAADDPLVGALLQALATDQSQAVRAATVSLLRRHLDAGPDISAALTRAAANDPSPGVRRLAAERRP